MLHYVVCYLSLIIGPEFYFATLRCHCKRDTLQYQHLDRTCIMRPFTDFPKRLRSQVRLRGLRGTAARTESEVLAIVKQTAGNGVAITIQ